MLQRRGLFVTLSLPKGLSHSYFLVPLIVQTTKVREYHLQNVTVQREFVEIAGKYIKTYKEKDVQSLYIGMVTSII